MTRKILIEGWRGISHSYALVNQYQILALLERGGFELFHNDLPFYGTRWNVKDNNAGFDAARQARIDGVPPLGDARPDTIYRIGFPPRGYGGDAEKVYCFNTLEYFQKPYFYSGPDAEKRYSNPQATIVTPSWWSKAAFVESGIAADRIVVVPHGIDPDVFHPVPAADRATTRRQMGIAEDGFVFLNVSAMTANKGVQHLLAAFGVIHARYPRARLFLKDHGTLYQSTAIRRLKHAGVTSPETMQAVTILSQNVPVRMMRQLYAAADAYISPYRAEGFNLPPLEAAACGTPIAVTAGGATDDYADPLFALKIASRPGFDEGFGRCLDPDMDSLIDCMDRLASGRAPQIDMEKGAVVVRQRHSWARVADRLAAIF